MNRKKSSKPAAAAPENHINPLPLKEQLKQRMLDRYDLEEMFGVNRNTIYNWCKAGILSFVKIGRKKFFDALEIDALIKERKQTMVPGEKKPKRK
jgi:predicted DNA-binding transcriptional regulator AlpA